MPWVRAGGELALAIGLNFQYTVKMTEVNTSIQKKRGRGRPPRPGGVDPVVPVRLPKKVLAAVDKWAMTQKTESRSDAIRQLVERGLAAANIDAQVEANRAVAPKHGRGK